MMQLSWITWDPPTTLFTLPFINHPITYYGILFVSGFVLGFFLLIPGLMKVLKNTPTLESDKSLRSLCTTLTDKLTLYVMAGTIIGARLGHVIFYELNYYLQNPLQIFMVWKGGLASHGGTIGVILALWFFSKKYQKIYPELTFITLLDTLALPTSAAVIFIRLGNFVNQEILGPPTTLPWGIIFGHPYDGLAGVPRHPTQLYEAIAYFITFLTLTALWKSGKTFKKGVMIGTFMIMVFGSRFFLEFLKAPLGGIFEVSYLQTGQVLSLPFIFLGCYFLFCKKFQQSSMLKQ